MSYKLYVVSTIGYGLVAIAAFAGGVYLLRIHRYFLALICLVMVYIALDNFFCGHRAKAAGIDAHSHYFFPFKKRKKAL